MNNEYNDDDSDSATDVCDAMRLSELRDNGAPEVTDVEVFDDNLKRLDAAARRLRLKRPARYAGPTPYWLASDDVRPYVWG